MASGFFARLGSRRLLGGGAAAIAAGVAGTQLFSEDKKDFGTTEAEIQFHTSYGYLQKGKQLIKPPEGWTGRVFEIRNDYPTLADVKNKGVKVAAAKNLPLLPDPGAPIHLNPIEDAPWLNVDFKTNPHDYCKIIKEYCWEGNVNNEFVLQKNKLRQWYHAPWMHWSQNGREPLNGLTFERPTPVGELAETQTRPLQTWACGYYNEAGAATFGDIWKDPNDPKWENVKFQLGTCVFKILMSDATESEVSTMKDAPTLQGVIAPPGAKNGSVRLDKPSPLGLLQVDFAVRDDRADTGWVFGTFMYDGNMKNPDPWDRLLPVGIMWGNDPELTPDKVAAGGKPKQSWINPVADDIRKSLAGSRPSWGWLGRMNGPADNFKSACASCHSVSERDHSQRIKLVPADGDSTEEKMRYFRNIPAGEPFTKGNVSGDYSLQLMMGYNNYKAWLNTQKNIFRRTMVVVPFTKANKEAAIIESIREPLRSTPEDREDDSK